MSTVVTSPDQFFGFTMGTDGKMARWDKIVRYFQLLESQSSRMKVVDMGPTTEGNPFLLAIISSPSNLASLEQYRIMNLRLNDPKRTTEKDLETILDEGKAVVCQSMSFHATEIGGTQMSSELAYDLLTRDDNETKRILENVIFLMIPCANPDGQILVTDWYSKCLGTEYEGCDPPWLYHKYAGHDNCRDAFQLNLIESRYMASILFRDWIPQVYVDHHHMGSYGARFFVPPYCEPIHPHVDPLIPREQSWYGSHMAYKLEEAGKAGVLNAGQYMFWHHLGPHAITRYHNTAGMHTESASAKLASPLYVHASQLRAEPRGPLRGFVHHRPQTNFPRPWLGGWWRLRDIVEQQKIAAWATLDLAARHRETVLKNAYLKARRQSERGAQGETKAYVISSEQPDLPTAEKLVEKLLLQGIEIHVSNEAFTAGNVKYPPRSWIIFLDQPKSGLVRTLLGQTHYPDDAWTRAPDGSPIRPSDTATDTMAEFMGASAEPLEGPIVGNFERTYGTKPGSGQVEGESSIGYVLDCRLNDTYIAVNRLLRLGAKVWRIPRPIEIGSLHFASGAFLVQGLKNERLRKVAEDLHLVFHAAKETVERLTRVRNCRLGVYQRYWGGNIDEGWTRWLLEQFEFQYETIRDIDVRANDLRERFDVLILPNDQTPFITGENVYQWYSENHPNSSLPTFPPEYRSGIGREGVEGLKRFVSQGGTLVALNSSCTFAIEAFGLRIRNVLARLSPKEFFCPGSTLRAVVNQDHPFGYGMQRESLIFGWDSPAFDILPSAQNERSEVVVSYPEDETLRSGWLIGEEKLRNKAAMIAVPIGDGKVVLIGFRAQHRGQTHGTFKLLFNIFLA